MIAFVVGGVTRSEMRVAHKLTARTGREVLLGGTTVDNPSVFLRRLQVGILMVACRWNCTCLHPSSSGINAATGLGIGKSSLCIVCVSAMMPLSSAVLTLENVCRVLDP